MTSPYAEPTPPPLCQEINTYEEGLNQLNNNEIYPIITLSNNSYLTHSTDKGVQPHGKIANRQRVIF